MEFVINGSLEDRLKRIERKITIVTYLTFGSFLSLKTESKWAKYLFLFSDILIMLDTLTDLYREFRYRLEHRNYSKRNHETTDPNSDKQKSDN